MLHAFAAWLKLSAGARLDGPALTSHPLTKAAMEGLKSTDTFEDASDAVCELVLCTSSRGSPEAQMMPLVQLLVPAVRLHQLSSVPQYSSDVSHAVCQLVLCISSKGHLKRAAGTGSGSSIQFLLPAMESTNQKTSLSPSSSMH